MLYSVLTDQILLGEGYRNGAHSTLHEQLVVMFEDDGETGYFYAMDLDQKDNPIVVICPQKVRLLFKGLLSILYRTQSF